MADRNVRLDELAQRHDRALHILQKTYNSYMKVLDLINRTQALSGKEEVMEQLETLREGLKDDLAEEIKLLDHITNATLEIEQCHAISHEHTAT